MNYTFYPTSTVNKPKLVRNIIVFFTCPVEDVADFFPDLIFLHHVLKLRVLHVVEDRVVAYEVDELFILVGRETHVQHFSRPFRHPGRSAVPRSAEPTDPGTYSAPV